MTDYKVVIDGVNFISQNEIDKIVMKKVKNILYEECGLREDFVEDILKKHFTNKKNSETEKHYGKGHPRPQNAQFEFNSTASNEYKIKNVDKFGNIFHSKGKYQWDINSVLYIQNHMFDGMTYADVNNICKVLNLNLWVVGRIMYNIKQGIFKPIISTYENLIYQKEPVPIQNNPQKRKESYWI